MHDKTLYRTTYVFKSLSLIKLQFYIRNQKP